MSFIQSALGSIGDLLYGIVIWLLLFIDTFVYWLINLAYQSFLAISQIRIFSDDDLYDLSQRIYIVIGVFALFLVAYALLTAIINPDNNKSETSLGKVIPNIAKAIIGIAIVPGIFNVMYDVQHAALCSNVIPKLVLGSAYAEGFDITEGNSNSLGAQMSSLLFRSFFYVKNADGDPYDLSQATEIAKDIKENGCGGDDCLNLYQAYQDVENGGPFSIFQKFTDAVVDGRIGYFYILSTIAGGFCVYVLISLCLDMALRSVKLSYLQIIAPLPLLTIIIPGQKKVFTNWLKKTTSCFIEVFTRLFIVVFAAYIMRTLDDIFDTAFGTTGVYCGEVNGLVWFLVKAATIVGLFWFIKQAPKLISEVTGMDSKGFKLGIKDKLAESGAFSAMGAIGAGATAGIQNMFNKEGNIGKKLLSGIGGIGSGAVRGYASNRGSKNYRDLANNIGKAANDATAARINREYYKNTHGGTFTGAVKGHFDDVGEVISDWARGTGKGGQNAKADALDKIKKYRDVINDTVDKDNRIKALNAAYEGEISRIKESPVYSQEDVDNVSNKLKNLQDDINKVNNSTTMSDAAKQARLDNLRNEENKLKADLDQMSRNTIDGKQTRLRELQTIWDTSKSKMRSDIIKELVGKKDLVMQHHLENYVNAIASNRALVAGALEETMSGEDYDKIANLITDKGIKTLSDMIMKGEGFNGANKDDIIGAVANKISSSADKKAKSLRIEQAQKDNNKK